MNTICSLNVLMSSSYYSILWVEVQRHGTFIYMVSKEILLKGVIITLSKETSAFRSSTRLTMILSLQNIDIISISLSTLDKTGYLLLKNCNSLCSCQIPLSSSASQEYSLYFIVQWLSSQCSLPFPPPSSELLLFFQVPENEAYPTCISGLNLFFSTFVPLL